MVNNIVYVCILLCVTALGHAAGFSADVDRTRISENESLTLILRTDEQVGRDPDLTPLQQHWDVTNTQRSSQFRLVNGRSSSWTQWSITLMPKRNGTLQIPSLEYAGERTNPINIIVEKGNNNANTADQNVFFETSVDVKQTYVQAQVLYTEKLYFAVPLDNHKLSEVEVADALVQPLGNTRQFRTSINGRRYDVFERQYVIFPQTSGDMIIPGPRYYGEISRGLWQPGQPVRVSHAPTSVKILPKPAQYPNAPWLPANQLILEGRISGDTRNMHTGEPVTLNITLKASGLNASQLPEIQLPVVNNLKYYPDQGSTQDINDTNGIMGQRTQSIAILAGKAGQYSIPEIKIPWWNVTTGQVEYATLAAQTLNVGKAENATTITLGPDENTAPAEENNNDTDNTSVSGSTAGAVIWQISTAILAILWAATLLAFFIYWRRASRQPLSLTPAETAAPDINALLHKLKNACRENQPNLARQHLISWGNLLFSTRLAGLQELAEKVNDEKLALALRELDYTLFAKQNNSVWQGEQLWTLIKRYKPAAQMNAQPITDLYPL